MIAELKDTFRHQGLRKKLIAEIREKKVASDWVLDAMLEVPRHVFFDGVFVEKAYIDQAFPIAAGQTISQPTTVAIQSTLLQVKPKDKVLEIGTGSGYQAAILCKMGVRVFSIERQRILYRKSKQLLSHISCKADVRYGDGFKGIPQFAPYQGIIITCGAPHIPESLIDQLALNGRMVVPLGEGSHQEMVVVYKDKDGKIHQTKHGSFAFVPMLKDKAK